MDEIDLGGRKLGARGRSRAKKAVVAVAPEEAEDGIGRIRLRHVPYTSAASLEAFILDAVESSSSVRTNGCASHSRLQALGYRHLRASTGGNPECVDRNFPRVHRVASLLASRRTGLLLRARHQDRAKHAAADVRASVLASRPSGAVGFAGPRLHDLRYRFAIETRLRRYREGPDVELRASCPATYFGHVQVRNIDWYLSATPELLQCAARRPA